MKEGEYILASGLRGCLAPCTWKEQPVGGSIWQRRALSFIMHQKGREGEMDDVGREGKTENAGHSVHAGEVILSS